MKRSSYIKNRTTWIAEVRKVSPYLMLYTLAISIMFLCATIIMSTSCSGGSSVDSVSNDEKASAGPLQVSSNNPRYFTDGSGKAIYLTGSHNWNNLVEEPAIDPNDTFNYPGYLNFLNDHNHNFIRLWSNQLPQFLDQGKLKVTNAQFPWPRLGPGTALDGKPKFDLAKFDQSYFDRLRSRVIAARDKGIYASIMFFEGWCLAGQEAGANRECWTWHPFNTANNINGVDADANGDGKGYEFYSQSISAAVKDIQKAYIRKIVDTVNDLDNVLYEIANEAAPGSVSWQYEMVNYVKSYESTKAKRHPVGMTYPYRHSDNGDLFSSPADWISPGYFPAEDYRGNPPPSDGRKVIILDTDHLWGVGGDRAWVWKSFVRGLNPVSMDPLDADATQEDTRKAMGHTLSYAKRVNLKEMLPSNDLSSTTFCLANPGSEYLIYQPEYNKPFTVNLSAGRYNFEWFNPVAGKIILTGSFTANDGNRSFYPPISGDSILYLFK
ncbi:MAG: DUF6298 domain-containing protein [Nitrospirota bacterium]